MIAIDTSVLVDLLGDDERAESAETALRSSLSQGPVVVCEVVISEVVAGLGHGSVLMDVLDEAGIGFSAMSLGASIRAGEMQRRHKERLRRAKANAETQSPRSIPDFLIGAHALMQCSGLITRDAGFFRDYFKGLKVIVPKA
jgi:predicted nucleic acid-binding protein